MDGFSNQQMNTSLLHKTVPTCGWPPICCTGDGCDGMPFLLNRANLVCSDRRGVCADRYLAGRGRARCREDLPGEVQAGGDGVALAVA